MKVGILIDRLNVGGVEKISIEQVTALRKMGVDATLVVLRKKAVVENAFEDMLGGVPVVFLDSRLPRILRFSFQFPLFHFFSSFHVTYPFLLPWVLKKHEFDYFITHGTYTSLSAVAFKKFNKIGFSSFIWDPASYILQRVYSNSTLKPIMWVLKKMTYLLDKFLINNMDSVLVGGDAHNTFIQNINPKKPIHVIYPSVHPIAKPKKKSGYVLMATAWKQGKNPDYILEVAAAIPNIHIKMVGKWLDPQYRADFESLVKERKLEKHIEIVGGVSEAELSDAYAKALVVLQTNDDRGFGMPALEAAGSATTFIIPKAQGVCKLFTDKKDGYYTTEKDTKTIVKLLNGLLKDKERAIDMGIAGWNKVKANYSWQQHATSLKKVVEDNTAKR